ncbi:hypothetical protein LIER_26629 [Lithospermum erythrorhizon]|uniref:Uncharacterized protein n=1 Tax=Lithospermum erythrorhizon TaxID=34254 RepID=A0AAV3RAJ5_LITER
MYQELRGLVRGLGTRKQHCHSLNHPRSRRASKASWTALSGEGFGDKRPTLGLADDGEVEGEGQGTQTSLPDDACDGCLGGLKRKGMQQTKRLTLRAGRGKAFDPPISRTSPGGIAVLVLLSYRTSSRIVKTGFQHSRVFLRSIGNGALRGGWTTLCPFLP